ncbi:MAG TPA: prolipoprotein diacylglyceryl transferase family protein [Vicinamibacterales bacterium]|nr:prolipoprotein diacylglyceryl transferase family protein [Vicinamibacterales bacterium]
MFPVLFRIGGFEITSFGALVALGALAGLWIFRRELRRSALPENAADAALAGIFGGVAGAKLLWVVEHLDEGPFLDLLFSRGGMSWFGGFAGGLLAGIVVMRLRRLPVIPVLAAATPALAIGHAIGRVGCLLVGDDYGFPTELPWGIAFPQGLPPTDVPVHPTMVYEALALVPLAWLLIRLRRRGTPDVVVLGTYLAMAGFIRFAIEFLRINERVLGPLSVAHIAALLAVAAGLALLAARRTSHAAGRT